MGPRGAINRPDVFSPAVFAVGLVVFGWGVAAVSPWRDEAATLAVCRRSVGEILAVTRSIDLVHLAYYLMAHVALRLHDSVTTVRLISVVAMAAAAAMLVRIGRRLGDPTTGALAGLLLVASPLASRWAQDARPFALVTAVAVASTLALLRSLDRRAAWWWYGASLVGLGVLNVLALLLVGVHAAYVLVTRPRRDLWRWLRVVAVAGLVVSPFVAMAFGQRGQVAWITVPHLTDLLAPFASAFGSLYLLPPVGALTLLAAALLWWARGRIAPAVRDTAVLGTCWAVVPPVVLWAVSQVVPLWDAHYVLFALPGLSLVVAQVLRVLAGAGRSVARGRHAHRDVGRPEAARSGFGRGRRELTVAAVAAVLCLAGLPAQAAHRDPASGHGEDMHGVAEYLAAHGREGDSVLYAPFRLRAIGTVYPDLTSRLADVALARTPAASETIQGIDVGADELPARLHGYHRVWLVHGPYRIRESVDKVKVGLPGLGYHLTSDVQFAGFVVSCYEK